MADNSTETILAAIGALDEKFDKRFGELKKADEHHVEELQRLGTEQRALRKDVDELRSETRRTFDAERHALRSTTEAITKHVDDSAKAFQEKAGKIDALEKMQVEQMATLSDIASAVKHPMVRKIVWGLGTLLLAWLASKGIR